MAENEEQEQSGAPPTLQSHMNAKWGKSAEEEAAFTASVATAVDPEVKPDKDEAQQQDAPPKPAAAQPEEKDDKPPKSAKDWTRYKEAAAAREAEARKQAREEAVKEYEAKIAEIQASKKSDFDPAEFEAVKKERDELSERLRAADLEKHPEFQRHFTRRLELQMNAAKRLVGDDNAALVEKALKMEDGVARSSLLESISENMTPLQSSRLSGIVNMVDIIQQEKAEALANASSISENLRKKTEQESKKAMESSRAEFEKIYNAVLAEATDKEKGNPVLIKTGDAEWDKAVDERMAIAKNILFGNLTPAQSSKAALYAASLPATLKMVSDLKLQLAEANEKIKSLTAAAPKIGGATEKPSSSSGDPARPKVTRGMNPMEASREWMKIALGD